MLVTAPPAAPPTTREGLSLFRVIEVWTIDESGSLVPSSAIYRDAPAMEASSVAMTIDVGDGLPGQVAAREQPVVFPQLQAEDFLRSEAAAADGLSAGVGFPVFRDGKLTAVVLVLFTNADDATGAIESWLPDKERNELRLGTAHYAGLKRFEMISRYVQFPYGSGLPGTIKQTATPTLLTGLARSKEFIRAAGAEADGLSIALAWPVISYGDDLRAVVVLLSSSATPLARVFQVWGEERGEGDTPTAQLVPRRNASEDSRQLAEATAAAPVAIGRGLLGRVWQTGLPLATSDFSEESADVQKLAEQEQIAGAIAIPVFRGPELKGIVALWG